MPFYPPHAQLFQDGDLVYGLSPSREIYAKLYEQFHRIGMIDCYAFIDQYAGTATERQCYTEKPANNCHFLASLQSHKKYKSAYYAKGFACMGTPVHKNKDIRRKVKGGLFWASDSGNITVHFILDGINIEEVVHKSNKMDKDKHQRSYTGSELRWIYRNRHLQKVAHCIQFWYEGQATFPPWSIEFQRIFEPPYNVESLWKEYSPKTDKRCNIL